MNEELFDYTASMNDIVYKGFVRSLFLFLTLLMIFVAFLFRASPKSAIIILIINFIAFLIIFPGRII